jgi:hypothetical protein
MAELLLADLFVVDPSILARRAPWTELTGMVQSGGGAPSARHSHGFASAGGLVYLHGGLQADGELLGFARELWDRFRMRDRFQIEQDLKVRCRYALFEC